MKLEKEELKKLILEEKFTLADVVDTVVEINGIIGVGLITLGEQLRQYCLNKIDKNVSL
jgi:uncharacterized Fe-S cluster-containing MiaB family protein